MKKVPLTWENRACLGSYQPHIEGTHDPGKIVADLAAAVALGGDCLADIAVLREQSTDRSLYWQHWTRKPKESSPGLFASTKNAVIAASRSGKA
jgi:hypothetical protein